MKKIIFPLLFLFAFVANAQNKTIKGSFTLKNLVDQSKLEFYTSAIENANFEELRLLNQSQEFKFDNGFVLELPSAYELKNKGLISETSQYKLEHDKDFQAPLFSISTEGRLVSLHYYKLTKTELKINSTK